MERIKILLADKSEIFLIGLAKVLDTEWDMKVVAICSDLEESFLKAIELRPDVIICGIRISENIDMTKGIELSKRLYKELPSVQTIVLADKEEEKPFFMALQLGARAYISKYVTAQYLVSTIRRIYAGEVIISAGTARKLLREVAILNGHDQVVQENEDLNLTGRETEILRLVAAGMGNKEMANALFISENTVKKHISTIFQKLQVCNRQQAAVRAIDIGIVPKDSNQIRKIKSRSS